MQSNLKKSAAPVVLGVDELARLLHKSRASILTYRSRSQHRLPPACTPPGTKHPLWILEDVLAWLRQHQEPAPPAPPAPPQPRRRGRPTKAEAAARRAAEKGGAQ